MEERTTISTDCVPPERTRETYLPPELRLLGTLAEITQKVGYLGAADGGRFPFGYKTSF
jgi:hypothetical protein